MAAAGAAHPWTGEALRRKPDWGGREWKEMFHPVLLPPSQLEELKQQLEVQEEELGRLRLGVVRLLGAGLQEEDERGGLNFQVS